VSDRAEKLATQFEQLNADLISTIEGCSDEQWRATCQEENWPVAVTAHHIASGYTPIVGLLKGMAAGVQFPPLTLEQVDGFNAQHAQQFASVSKQETIEALRDGAATAAEAIRSLTDDQLGNSAVILAGDPASTTEQAVQALLIDSTTTHLQSIRAAI
jgi:uncharacterized damage-inducible protein DinB